jgi:hypothetical protein
MPELIPAEIESKPTSESKLGVRKSGMTFLVTKANGRKAMEGTKRATEKSRVAHNIFQANRESKRT